MGKHRGARPGLGTFMALAAGAIAVYAVFIAVIAAVLLGALKIAGVI